MITWERCGQNVKGGAFDFFSGRDCKAYGCDMIQSFGVEGKRTVDCYA